MSVQSQIEQKLSDALSLDYSEVVNESHMHNVPAGSESHFKLVLVANDFEGLSLVARHKLIYKILDAELQAGVHALALHTYTKTEWEKKQGQAPESPLCHGGSK
jgi:BolA protein